MGTSKDNLVIKLCSAEIDTPLGKMLAVADDTKLYALEFIKNSNLKNKIEKLQSHTKATISPCVTSPIISIKAELEQYFARSLKKFTTPFHLLGSEFQKQAWQELLRIPYGETRSYLKQACALGKKTAHRAIANANGANNLAIVIPCHRVIKNDGKLGGYGGGVDRKQWLINLEQGNY